MPQNLKLIPKELSEIPIEVPQNPFWQVFKRFGRDEMLALIINVSATALIAFFTTVPIILALAGPILEKIGFFPANFLEARKVYKTTPKKQRKHMSHYLRLAFKNSAKSLTEDILIHDPLYIIFMFTGLAFIPSAPVWMIAATSFIIAVVIVTVLEVAYTEIAYIRFKRKLRSIGFQSETYYETRFFISSTESQKDLLENLQKTFNLTQTGTLEYNDLYYENRLKEYSGRFPKVRLRSRGNDKKRNLMQTLQIVYSKAQESSAQKHDQYRFFPMKKEKLCYVIKNKMPESLEDVKNIQAKKILKHSIKLHPQKISFQRRYARNKDLLVTLDKIAIKRNFYLLELKTKKNTQTLIEAMRYVMQKFPVVQTTKGKYDLDI